MVRLHNNCLYSLCTVLNPTVVHLKHASIIVADALVKESNISHGFQVLYTHCF